MLTPTHKDSADTIAAIATPVGVGGIGVVKISGPRARNTAKAIFQNKKQGASPCLKPHHLHAGYIVDPSGENLIDEVLLVYMPGPASYTREDVVEIQCHSGYMVLERILDLVLSQEGLRLAEPGEFTRRAFLNGRMDLTQVEAVLDLVGARTNSALKQAAAQLGGTLCGKIQHFRDDLATLLAHVESAIDFPDEDIEVFSAHEMGSRLTALLGEMKSLLNSYEGGRLVREGLRVAIIGRPNVGKSSLLNALLEEERAIVFHLPGTTRDIIEESITISGMPVTFIDTAGLSPSPAINPVEQMGTQRTRAHAGRADMVFFVLDASCLLHSDDQAVFEEFWGKDMVVVLNKRDLPCVLDQNVLPTEMKAHPCVSVSAKYRQNIDSLKDALRDHIIRQQGPGQVSSVLINRLRHKTSLEKSTACLEQALRSLKEGVSIEFIALDLREALDRLGEVVGEMAPDEILDQIFSEFCIGK